MPWQGIRLPHSVWQLFYSDMVAEVLVEVIMSSILKTKIFCERIEECAFATKDVAEESA
jgi:hypothetical protein